VVFISRYVVATVLPPLLPTVFTVSVGISDNRLAKRQIACTNSEGILVAGKVKRAFFDKTGTLTKQGLDFLSTRCATTWDTDESTDLSDAMALGMAACHSLTRFESGVTVGNPVDRVMFEASGASFVDMNGEARVLVTDCKGNRLEVVKHFDFDHHRMTQSVIVKMSDGRLIAIAKGSGESIKKVCLPDSLPRDFEAVARSSAKSGIYQISMATKVISAGVDLSQMPRGDIEKDLVFAGVVNFKNVIREETWDVICQLEAGEVKTVMVTGDSMLTGVCIARESGMIKAMQCLILGSDFDSNGEVIWVDESDAEVELPSIDAIQASNTELAVTGEVWQSLRQADPKMAMVLAEHIRVYGRCTPFDKVSVVSTFVELGYITLMCGDGGNDCGALKTAHVGVALSDAEASMVSPFTSLDKSLTSVVEVLKEGRCALASALASYKYLIMYGQIEALTQIMNAYFRISFSEWCWAVLDGVYPISMAFSLPNSKAASSLAPSRPTSSLLGPHTLASALGVLALHFLFTVIALTTLFHQDWFQCRKWDRSDVSDVLVIGDNYEAQTLFLVTSCQYISTAMAYNFGYEWRQSWIRNYFLVTLASVFMAMQFFITLVPGKMSCFWRVNCDNDHVLVSVVKGEKVPIQNPFNTTVMPVEYRWSLIAIIVANTLTVIAWDYFVVNGTRKKLGARKREQAQVCIGATKTLSDKEADAIV
jgi:predicted P-type ATPase